MILAFVKMLLYLFISISYVKSQFVNLVCTKQFCDDYIDKNGCPPLSIGCKVQNATHMGSVFPSPTRCSCCEICLEYLFEGDFCSIGAPGAPVPTKYCGPGLKCKQINNEDPKCVAMDDTVCFQKQIEFDKGKEEGTLGHLMQRPSCDGDGFFSPIMCIPGEICFCVDKNGQRIFGEEIYSEFTKTTMKCECSRMASTFSDLVQSKYPQLSSRCLDDGSFDPLQCIGDKCFCINRWYGTVNDNARSGASNEKVPIYLASDGLDKMPCFNKNWHTNNITYLNDCEAEAMELANKSYEYENQGYIILDGMQEADCNPNGFYQSVQEDENFKYCADNRGNRIDGYAVLKTTAAASNMNCNCARARKLVPTIQECCPNGSFKKVVCRRGECYCVDENGLQISKELPESQINNLVCYNNGIFC